MIHTPNPFTQLADGVQERGTHKGVHMPDISPVASTSSFCSPC